MARAVIVVTYDDKDHPPTDMFDIINDLFRQDSTITLLSLIREPAYIIIETIKDLKRGQFTPATPKKDAETKAYAVSGVASGESKKGSISDIVSPNVERKINEKGAAQSHVPVRFDLIDGPAIFEMAKVLHTGAEKYGANNWRGIDVGAHLNHLIMHAYAYLSDDRTDEHLSHVMCRSMFAQAVAIEQGGDR